MVPFSCAARAYFFFFFFFSPFAAVIYYEWPQLAYPPRGCVSRPPIGWLSSATRLAERPPVCGRVLSMVEVGYLVTRFLVDIPPEPPPWVREAYAAESPLPTGCARLFFFFFALAFSFSNASTSSGIFCIIISDLLFFFFFFVLKVPPALTSAHGIFPLTHLRSCLASVHVAFRNTLSCTTGERKTRRLRKDNNPHSCTGLSWGSTLVLLTGEETDLALL